MKTRLAAMLAVLTVAASGQRAREWQSGSLGGNGSAASASGRLTRLRQAGVVLT